LNGPSAGGSLQLAQSVLSQNWREGERNGVRYAYTAPSVGRYPWQWYWDSCFAAIVWRRFDRGRARAELESLLAAQRPGGFIGHTVFWHRPVSWTRRPFYNVGSRRALTTETIQPPLLAWAWRIAVGDPAEEPRIAAHHSWLAEHRVLDEDGLLWIIQPDESGLDASPKFDPIWGWRAHARPGFVLLVRRMRELGFDLGAALRAGEPVVCELTVNVLYCLSLLALGRPSITPAIVDRLHDPPRGLFLDRVRRHRNGRVTEEAVPVETWTALAPLALPDLPEEIGRRLVEEHLLDDERFWLPVPPPSVSAAEPSFQAGRAKGIFRAYWRGPAWVNTAWLLWLGVRRLGYLDIADELARRVIAAVDREGLHEYYNPYTGRGLGATDFAWSTLVAELAEPDPAAARSYL
jgi:mannosylglycerate hydrolase MGH1-like protein